MFIKIKYIRDAGDIDKERLVLQTFLDCEIGNYLTSVSIKTNNGNSVLSKIRGTYWFPDGKIPAGSLVVLYTKQGKNSIKNNNDGSKSFFYYRNETAPVFSDPNSCAIIFEINKWTYDGKRMDS